MLIFVLYDTIFGEKSQEDTEISIILISRKIELYNRHKTGKEGIFSNLMTAYGNDHFWSILFIEKSIKALENSEKICYNNTDSDTAHEYALYRLILAPKH